MNDLSILKTSYIRKLPNGKYRVFAESGRNLGTYESRSAAEKRLRQVEYFKHKDENKADDETYSSMLRKLNKEKDIEGREYFLTAFKNAFDSLVLSDIEEPAEKALPIAIFMLMKQRKDK